MKRDGKTTRVYSDFEKEMKKIMQERVMKGLARPYPSDISMKEATRLMMRTQGWSSVVNELKTKPKKS